MPPNPVNPACPHATGRHISPSHCAEQRTEGVPTCHVSGTTPLCGVGRRPLCEPSRRHAKVGTVARRWDRFRSGRSGGAHGTGQKRRAGGSGDAGVGSRTAGHRPLSAAACMAGGSGGSGRRGRAITEGGTTSCGVTLVVSGAGGASSAGARLTLGKWAGQRPGLTEASLHAPIARVCSTIAKHGARSPLLASLMMHACTIPHKTSPL